MNVVTILTSLKQCQQYKSWKHTILMEINVFCLKNILTEVVIFIHFEYKLKNCKCLLFKVIGQTVMGKGYDKYSAQGT